MARTFLFEVSQARLTIPEEAALDTAIEVLRRVIHYIQLGYSRQNKDTASW